MNTKNRVRIVNKSKETITLDFKGNIGLKTSKWDEFNKMYEICPDDKRYCILKPEWKERIEKAGKLLDQALIYYLQVDWKVADPNETPDLVQMGMVGLYVEEISKLLECSYFDAMVLLNDRAIQVRSAFGGPSGFAGLGIKKQNPEPEENPKSNPNKVGNTIAEFNPDLAKLKEQLENEEGK